MGEEAMNRRFAISAAVVFVVWMALDFFVHGVLLYGDYASIPNVMRPPADANTRMPLMALAYVFMAVAFTWIYVKGRENKPWLPQGVRYGVAVAFLTVIPTSLIYHVVTQVPLDLAIKQIVLGFIVIVIVGIVLAWLNR
jgi:hypothetical protein